MIPAELTNEHLLCPSLEPEVKQKFIQLLTLETDARRDNRVNGDTICTMVQQVQTNGRKITIVSNKGSEANIIETITTKPATTTAPTTAATSGTSTIGSEMALAVFLLLAINFISNN